MQQQAHVCSRSPGQYFQRHLWMILGSVMLALLVSSCSSAPTAAIHGTPTAAVKLTPSPTVKPTPTGNPTVGSQASIGNTLAAFNAKYGSPVGQGRNANGSTTYQYNSLSSNIGQLNLVTFPHSSRIYGMIMGPPSGQNWDAKTAFPTCLAFVPRDSILSTTNLQVLNASGAAVGLYQDANSVELANSLPSSDFFNQDSAIRVQPGTFSLLFLYVAGSNGTASDACSIVVGDQTTRNV